uniref:Uncharacterized protein n=1 Tax=Oryza brachyantha TaxID=4533 RepID=J3L7P8_ORYBR
MTKALQNKEISGGGGGTREKTRGNSRARDKTISKQGERYLSRGGSCTAKVKQIDRKMHRDQLIGSAFIAFGITLLAGFFYAAVLSKMLPPYENRFLSAIQNDRYYCLLVPLTLPVIIVAVYLHWLSMKMFKHA